MKKYFLNIIMFIILIIVLFGLTGCNNSSNNNSKGSRSNPYKIGDIIELKNIAKISSFNTLEGQKFDLKFKVNKIYSEDEGLNIRKSKYDTYTTLPIANVTFTLMGNYQDEIYYNEAFAVQSINENMESPYGFAFENDNQENVSYIYTGNEYTFNILGKYDMDSKKGDKIKYVILNYADKDEKQNTIYIDITSTDIAENNKKQEGNKEDIYESAIELINNKEYDEAKDILKEILDYKDSKEYTSYCIGMHYYNFKMYGKAINNFNKCDNILDARELKEELLNIVSKYNGTYYYQYPGNDFLGYYLFIKDGKADIYSKSLYNDGDSIYYNYSINSKYNNSLNKDELYIGSAIFEKEPDSKNYEFLFYELPDGGIAVSSQEGSVNTMYSGVYDKISDSVPPEK